ncbi:hypothetical protein Q1695_002268 [Nippostrongylus brasiliensis]|nr:hypothetical protein Q1695_002268 [Nippostrongylus brasiliensis]
MHGSPQSSAHLPSCTQHDLQQVVCLDPIALLDKMTTDVPAHDQTTQETSKSVEESSSSCSPGTSSSESSRESTPRPECPIQAAKEAVFNMLYQYQAIPVRAKILSDCILSTMDDVQVNRLLESAGWTRNEYVRGYRTMDVTSRASRMTDDDLLQSPDRLCSSDECLH